MTVFTPRTLAERWQCSERHVRNMVDRGELPAFRLGTLLRIREEDVETLERQGSESQDAGESSPVMTPRMLADRWQCSPGTIYNMIERGELAAFKFGGKLLRIRSDVVEAFERQSGGLPDLGERSVPCEANEGEAATLRADGGASEPAKPKKPRAKPLVSRRELNALREKWKRESMDESER